MKNAIFQRMLCAAICAAGLLLLDAKVLAANGSGNGGQCLEKILEHVTKEIQHIENMLAKHPNAPAAVQSAAQKLLTDLNTLKSDLTAAQAAGPGARQGEIGKLKADHQAVHADRQALRQAIEASGCLGKGGLLNGKHAQGINTHQPEAM